MSAERAGDVFAQALRLGATSVGGPIAHRGDFERTYVRRLRWLDADEYASLVATCQVLPGPTSSQVGFLIGLRRAGWAGAFAAWLGFTTPSALLMLAFAWTLPRLSASPAVLLHGLALATVAVVAQAVASMARRLCTDVARVAIAGAGAFAMLLHGSAALQFVVLAAGAVLGMLACRDATLPRGAAAAVTTSRAALLAPALALAGVVGAFAAAAFAPHGAAAFLGVFYRAGTLVFGGGHVVLPLLRDGLVPAWIGDDAFLSAYGFAQALPGPLFAIAAYLGAVASPPGGIAAMAALALLALFLPGMLLAVGAHHLFGRAASRARVAPALAGVNAAVVGLLAAALYDPVFTGAVHGTADAMIALGALVLLGARVPPLAVVAGCVACAMLAS
ncbi:MAG: chromate efflux transporter [Dokdonella sp.]|uniref:chromate efflux transporter n=1 Tax=Dokdonella sp. TaxID=2291710 RepID=UPI003F823BE6